MPRDEFSYEAPGEFKNKPNASMAVAPVAAAGIEVAKAKAAQEIQAAVFMAKQFPRDHDLAYARIMKACGRKTLANQSVYSYPRGKENITGPSIRLAEAIAQNWGNLQCGIKEIDQRDGVTTMEAYAWDLETNTRIAKEFHVKHERHTKYGVNKLTDPRDLYEVAANNGARRMRACILAIIPGDVVEDAVKECRKTIGSSTEPLDIRVRNMVNVFEKEFRVTKDQVEKYIGYPSANFNLDDLVNLIGVHKSIKDGASKREDWFAIVPEVTEAEKDFKKMKEGSVNEVDK